MVLTRSMLQKTRGVVSVIFNTEMDRIRNEYSSSDEGEKKVKAYGGFATISEYLTWLKGPAPVIAQPPKIDFDDAHDEWNANKKRKTNGNYAYICGAPLKNGKKCNRECCDKIGLYSGCRTHYSWEESKNKQEPFRLRTF